MLAFTRQVSFAARTLARPDAQRYAFRCAVALRRHKHTIQTFRLADIGEGITECEVIRWSVKPSASIQAFDPLCEVQSDKASVEITSPFEGVVRELLVKEGEIAKVGDGLCLIEVEDEVEHESDKAQQAANPPSKPELGVDSEKEVEPAAPRPAKRPHPLDPSSAKAASSLGPGNELATPSVRHYAREKGVNLSDIGNGSGKGGRIERSDIDAFLARAQQTPSSSQPSASAAQSQSEITLQLGRTRWAMWKSMTKSLEIPHFGYASKLDVTELSALLPTLNSHIPAEYSAPPADDEPQAVSPHSIYGGLPPTPANSQSDPLSHYTKMTLLPLLIKTLSYAMAEWPLFRSSINFPSSSSSSDKPTLTVRPTADICFALSTPSGLYTPTLTDVGARSPYALQGALRRLAALGRQVPAGLGPAELPRRGGTLTVSNIGGLGRGEDAFPLLFPGGGVAIVAFGRARWEEVYDGPTGPGRRRLMLPTSWSADHRVVEGAELVVFVEAWRAWVEHPERLAGVGR